MEEALVRRYLQKSLEEMITAWARMVAMMVVETERSRQMY